MSIAEPTYLETVEALRSKYDKGGEYSVAIAIMSMHAAALHIGGKRGFDEAFNVVAELYDALAGIAIAERDGRIAKLRRRSG